MRWDCLDYMRSETKVSDLSETWDCFVSAFNGSARVQSVFGRVRAGRKVWVALPEYHYEESECPVGDCLRMSDGASEADVAEAIASHVGISDALTIKLCIDMTGFMRPHILAIVRHLADLGVSRYYMMYTEPDQYIKKEHTPFSGEDVSCVRQVIGYEGIHDDDVSRDFLILGMGYDDGLVSRVVSDKDGARIVRLMSLPSLSADMYQESILRLDRTGVVSADDSDDWVVFAPANDPFVVAAELSDIVSRIEMRGDITNLYLCPLATKVQALGFALYYTSELRNEAASIIFPFAETYERETSLGVGKTWLYEIEGAASALDRSS
jgi:hypothetical protein